MKRFTRLVSLALTAAFVVSFAASVSAATVIKLGTTVNEQDSFQVAAVKFSELVKERTGGKYVIEIYPNASLGDERTMLEGMRMGTMDMGVITSGPFVNFVPDFGVLDMPFLFRDNAHVYAVLDGPIGQEFLDKLDKIGIKGLAYAERGFRNLTNNVRAVKTADDVKGLKVRVMENEVYTRTFKALGVNAVPMAFTETLTALQQGTIDGQENPVNLIHAYKLWDSQKHASLTRHAYAAALFTMSKRLFDKFPADVQKILKDSAQDAAVYQRAWVAENEADQIAAIKANGMAVEENPDIESFKKGVQSVYDSYPQFKDYVSKIQAVE